MAGKAGASQPVWRRNDTGFGPSHAIQKMRTQREPVSFMSVTDMWTKNIVNIRVQNTKTLEISIEIHDHTVKKQDAE